MKAGIPRRPSREVVLAGHTGEAIRNFRFSLHGPLPNGKIISFATDLADARDCEQMILREEI
jgi:hypothetical protein